MAKSTTKRTKPAAKAPRFLEGTTDHDQDGSMGGSMTQAEADRQAVLHRENGNVIQLAQDVSAFIRSARALGVWKGRLFDDVHSLRGNADLDQLLRGAVPSYDHVDNPELFREMLTAAAVSGDMAEDLLHALVGNDSGLRKRYPDAFKDMAPA